MIIMQQFQIKVYSSVSQDYAGLREIVKMNNDTHAKENPEKFKKISQLKCKLLKNFQNLQNSFERSF